MRCLCAAAVRAPRPIDSRCADDRLGWRSLCARVRNCPNSCQNRSKSVRIELPGTKVGSSVLLASIRERQVLQDSLACSSWPSSPSLFRPHITRRAFKSIAFPHRAAKGSVHPAGRCCAPCSFGAEDQPEWLSETPGGGPAEAAGSDRRLCRHALRTGVVALAIY